MKVPHWGNLNRYFSGSLPFCSGRSRCHDYRRTCAECTFVNQLPGFSIKEALAKCQVSSCQIFHGTTTKIVLK